MLPLPPLRHSLRSLPKSLNYLCSIFSAAKVKISSKMFRKLLCSLLLFTFFFVSSQSRSILPKPQSFPSFKINTTTQKNQATCSFTVRISTSCSSVRYTRDRISLSFGDAYGNQVYAPRLDDPSTRTFERCSTDTFQVYGPCTYDICYLYLYRNGYDGWMPGTVEVYGYNTRPVSFYYNTFIPVNTWYGFNYCYGRRFADAASASV